jgi:hypothetical protein
VKRAFVYGRVSSNIRIALAVSLATGAVSLALFAPARSSGIPAATAPVPASSDALLDGYVFPGTDPTRVVVVLDVAPRLTRGTTATTYFDPNVVYAIDVDNVGDGAEHLTLQFQARGTGPLQRIEAFGPGVPVASGTDSTRFDPLGATTFDRTSTIDKGISFFAGLRRDPAFFDREQRDRIAAGRATCFRDPGKAENAYRDDDVLALVAEIPKTLLAPRKQGRIGVWWTASIAEPGGDGFRQIARIGRPGGALLVDLPSANSRSTALAAAIARLFAPDALQVDVEAPGKAGYLDIETATPTPAPVATMKKVPPPYRPFGGRALTSPAMARTLAARYGDLVPRALLGPEDGRETTCLESDNTTPAPNPAASDFPYLDDPL